MHLDAGAVQRYGFDLDAYNLRLLQLLEDPVENACLGPAIHTRVDGVPIAKAGRQTAPLAAMFRDVQDRVENIEVGKTDVAALGGQEVLDLGELDRCDFHARIVAPVGC